MGSDIFGVFQRRVSEKWEDIECYYGGHRDYALHGWLCEGGDRSGSCKFEPFIPKRGLPEDFDHDDGFSSGKSCNIGERGRSWFLGSEILVAKPPRVVRTIIATPTDIQYYVLPDFPPWRVLQSHVFERYVGAPDKISADGENIIYQWLYDFEEEFRYFIDIVRGYVDLHSEIRFVFGFN